jgi:O-antigen/teichoic acid export membrane protein
MASRTHNFISGLGAGYLAIAVNIAYTAVSVPLALHYLGNEQFGLWALAQQIAGYLMILDLGVSSAVSRFIADRKDEVNSSSYASLMMTSAIVFAAQGLLIALVGAAFSFFAPTLFSIPPHLSTVFTNVLIIITLLAGLSVVFRTLGAPLWAFQRLDVSYGLGSLSLMFSFIALWFGFQQGWGIYSFAFAGTPSAIILPIVNFWICRRNHYYPSTGFWGRPNWIYLRQIFLFGQDVLWMTLGSQMVNASQIMILSRVAGLSTASTFAVGTKLFTMAQQFTGRIIESSAPSLTEMFVRGASAKLLMRFTNVVSLTTLLATIGASALMAGNTPFISFWTSGTIQWSPLFDCILAALLLITSFSRCLISLFGIAGNMRPIRHIYFAEGALFIALALPAASYFGIGGLLSASLVAHFVVTCILSLRACGRILRNLQPIIRSGLVSMAITLFLALLSFFTVQLPSHALASIFRLAVLIALAALLSWLFIFTASLRAEFKTKFFVGLNALCNKTLSF